jgi:hypothetical protein
MDKNLRAIIVGVLLFMLLACAAILIENAQEAAQELAMAKLGLCKDRVPPTLSASGYDRWIPCPGAKTPPETPR